MPLTLQFGAWSPDLANVPVQVPDTQGPVVMPCADCLNVYYANGAYRSIASPAAASIDGNTVSALASQAINAFSYFDNVQQQETVFVGTATGLQQLASNGLWNSIAVVTSQSVSITGFALTLTEGQLANTNRITGQAAAFTLGTVTGTVQQTSFVAGQLGGANPHGGGSTLAAIGFIATGGTYLGTLISSDLPIGTLVEMADSYQSGAAQGAYFTIQIASDPGANAYTSLTANGVTQDFSSATYLGWISNGTATWQFPNQFGFANGATYSVAAI